MLEVELVSGVKHMKKKKRKEKRVHTGCVLVSTVSSSDGCVLRINPPVPSSVFPSALRLFVVFAMLLPPRVCEFLSKPRVGLVNVKKKRISLRRGEEEEDRNTIADENAF